MIIVTGATGFIGSAIVWELNQRDYKEIVCVDTVSPEGRKGILDKRDYNQFLTKDQIWDFMAKQPSVECIVHMGACSSTTEIRRFHIT